MGSDCSRCCWRISLGGVYRGYSGPRSAMRASVSACLLVLSHTVAAADKPTLAAAKAAAHETATACEHRTADGLRHHIALTAAGVPVEDASACLLRKLSTSKGGSAAAWGLASAAAPDRPELLAHARAQLGGKACQPFPPSWDLLGPLPIGKNEVDGDPLAARGGAFAHWLAHHNVSALTVRSEIVPGGLVGWTPLKPAADGGLNVGWPELPWGALVQALGQRAVLEVQAWAIGALLVVESGWYTLDVRGCHKALPYDAARPRAPARLVAADLYGGGSYGGGGFGVYLEAGVHVLALRLRMVVQKRLSVRLAPATAPWSIGPPPQVPDVVLAPRHVGLQPPTHTVAGAGPRARAAARRVAASHAYGCRCRTSC